MSTSDFLRALHLIEPDADTAAIHALLEELPNGEYRNIYTNLTYGPSADFASIPLELDEARVGVLVAIRLKVSSAAAKEIVAAAASGLASIDNFRIAFDLDEVVEGFRPVDRWNTSLSENAMCGTSSWCRERIGAQKIVDGVELSSGSLWDIVEKFSFLQQGRWLGIPLITHPEKIGDLDEVWPSPILLKSRRVSNDSSILVDLDIDRLHFEEKRLNLVGTAYSNGLITRNIDERGSFPKTLDQADCIDLRLLVDGVIMDQISGCFIKSIVNKLAVGSPAALFIPRYKARKKTEVSMGAAEARIDVVGDPIQASSRAEAWAVGQAFREERLPADAERFYDITSNPRAADDAFSDLRNLAQTERGDTITVVDPYALEQQALFSIVALAMPNLRPKKLRVYTEFKRPERIEATNQVSNASTFEHTNQDRSREEFYAIAQQIFRETNVAIEVYKTDRLHDRFILIGGRVWHVGPSFNTLGQEVAALVEMRDRRCKAELRAYLDRLTTEPIWKTQ